MMSFTKLLLSIVAAVAVILGVTAALFFTDKLSTSTGTTTEVIRTPYVSSVSCDPDGCRIMTGLVETGTRILSADDGKGCVRRTITLADTAMMSVPIVDVVRQEPDGTLLAHVPGHAQLPMPKLHTVEAPAPCPASLAGGRS